MAVLMMKVVPLSHAVLMVLIFIPFVYCQDHQMLTENCNWDASNWVRTTRGFKVTLTNPPVDLVPYLVCRTRFYINELSYTLKMRVRIFDLKGSNDCSPYSEMITLQVSDVANKSISWCGNMYPEEMILPVSAVDLIYKTGAFGEGTGFQLEFSAVPQYSCYDERKLEVTTQPKLLYSPNFPGNYKSQLDCEVQLHAKEDQYIHIQSLLVQIENSFICEYDALTINNVRYCGQDPIDVVVPASAVDIRFVTDGSKEKDGFILKYEALQTEVLNCTSSQSFEVRGRNLSTVFVMENHVFSYPWNGPPCQVWLDSGSDDKVLDVMLLSRPSDMASYTLMVDGETGFSQSGKLTIDSSGTYPYQDSGAIALNFLHSPGRRVGLSVSLKLQSEKFIFRVQAADREILPKRVLTRYPLVWVSADVARSQKISEMFVMPGRSGEKVEVDVFYTDRDHATLDHEADRLPVASYALVYNGEDTSYFELTRGCGTNTSSQALSVYSIRSQNVTVEVKRNATSRGFWMYFAPAGIILPQAEELSIAKNVSSISQVNVKNLYCKWSLSESSLMDLDRSYIRLRAENNFDPDNSDQYFIVKKEEIIVLKYTRATDSNLWFYSSNPISITVSIFSNAANLQPPNFWFTSDIVDSGNDLESMYCQPQTLQANETVQFSSTPNYPAFFRSGPCVWIISQNTEPVSRGSIVVEFPELYNFPCSEGHKFQIQTRNYEEEFIQWPTICGVSSFQQSYQNDQVKIVFTSGYQYMLPGFRFQYYTRISHTRDVTLLATEEFQFLSSPYYPADYPSSMDYQWLITTGSDSRVVELDLMDFVLEDETLMRCIHDYVEIYDGSSATAADRIVTMCGSVSYGHYSSTASDLTIKFHSDMLNNYKGFRFKYHSREKKLNVVDSRQNSTGIIIGVTAGGVVLLILIVGVIIYMLRRRKRQGNNSHIHVSVPGARRRGPMSRGDRSMAVMNGAPISPTAPPSYWETQNGYGNSDPPSYSSVHSSADLLVPQYAPGYICGQPGINLLGLPPPYSSELPSSPLQPDLYLELDASRLQSPSLHESTDNPDQPDPGLPAALRDRDDCHPYDMINDSVFDSSSTGDNTTTSNVAPAADNLFNNSQMSDPPPAYEDGSYVQTTGGPRHDSRRVPHIKNDRLGFL